MPRSQAGAPAFFYRFDWETPAFGGRLKAPHSVEVPFVFDTLHVIGEAHRTPRAQALADRVSKTWATFARNGDPGSDVTLHVLCLDAGTGATGQLSAFGDEALAHGASPLMLVPLYAHRCHPTR